MDLLARVRQFVRQHALFQPETPVVAALSGGSDSVALAWLLRELSSAGEVCLVGAAHFNHQLREQSDRDERFSASVAQMLAIPFLAGREDVGVRARRERRSIEDAGRRARYEFFERARRHFQADLVAVGHTRDDLAETFLLRLLRGAGPRGLAGIYPRHGSIVRPLLDTRRDELRAYLDQRHAAYIDDETNSDVAIPRNRIRAELLPLLASRFNPNIVDVLAREAELSREVWSWLESEAEGFEKGVVPLFQLQTPKKGYDPFFQVDSLRAAPRPLRRLVLWRAMNRAAGGRPVTFDHVESALELLDAETGAIDVPGHRLERIGSRLVLRNRRATIGEAANFFSYPLSIPGEVALPEAGCAVAAELLDGPADARSPARSGKGPAALVRGDLCHGPLGVRNRRPGDRFRPVGVGGRKKLQDFFVDRKVALARRDLVPLVVDDSDRIVWVAGYGIDEAFRVTDASQSVLLLRLRQV
jgi:tRNA(Ile)-lysidine synthase